jgi:hypothetical protein
MSRNCNTGLDERCRDENGTIRKKRRDTLVRTLRDEYGEDFAQDTRDDTKLGTVLDRAGADSLSEYLRERRRRG